MTNVCEKTEKKGVKKFLELNMGKNIILSFFPHIKEACGWTHGGHAQFRLHQRKISSKVFVTRPLDGATVKPAFPFLQTRVLLNAGRS